MTSPADPPSGFRSEDKPGSQSPSPNPGSGPAGGYPPGPPAIAPENAPEPQALPPSAMGGSRSSLQAALGGGRLPRIGFAFSSGVARGWAHIGVIRALLKSGIRPDVIAGTSIGAVVGGCYLAGRIDALEEWARSLNRMRIVGMLDLKVRSGGLIGGGRLEAELRRHIGLKRVEDLPLPFVAIATDLVTGHEVWLQQGPLVDVLRASFSLPGIFPPVNLFGRWMVDGALVDPLPVAACRALGAEIVIAINLNADILGKVKRADQSIPAAAGFDLLRFLEENGERVRAKQESFEGKGIGGWARRMFRRESDNPSLFGTMVASLNIMQDRITRSRLAGDPPDVQIVPRIGHIGLMEFDRAAELIAEGEEAVARAEPELGDAFRIFFQRNIGGKGL